MLKMFSRLPVLVAPSAGAWIEILMRFNVGQSTRVAPSAGAWIEIFLSLLMSIPDSVAPSAGAWIEIEQKEHG